MSIKCVTIIGHMTVRVTVFYNRLSLRGTLVSCGLFTQFLLTLVNYFYSPVSPLPVAIQIFNDYPFLPRYFLAPSSVLFITRPCLIIPLTVIHCS